MVIVHDTDKYKYFDKQRKVELIRYSNGVKNVYDGKAVYLPRRLYNGYGLLDNIVKFVSDNRHHKKYCWSCIIRCRFCWKNWLKCYRYS